MSSSNAQASNALPSSTNAAAQPPQTPRFVPVPSTFFTERWTIPGTIGLDPIGLGDLKGFYFDKDTPPNWDLNLMSMTLKFHSAMNSDLFLEEMKTFTPPEEKGGFVFFVRSAFGEAAAVRRNLEKILKKKDFRTGLKSFRRDRGNQSYSSSVFAIKIMKHLRCRRCSNHGVDARVKGHKATCAWASCGCPKCKKVKKACTHSHTYRVRKGLAKRSR